MTALATAQGFPPLENGDVMDAAEFIRRSDACEDYERAELIEGVVYMPMTISFDRHSGPHRVMLLWLLAYEALHPGEVLSAPPSSVILDNKNVPEPDCVLYRRERAVLDDRGLFVNPPDLAVEVAGSSVSRDLNQKKRAYLRNGIREYVVWRVDDGVIDWFEIIDSEYLRREPTDGVIKSVQFHGLKLDIAAALAQDLAAVQRAVR